MVGEREVKRNALFCEFSLERHVPEKHLLRAIDRFVELYAVPPHLAPFYCDGKTFDRMIHTGGFPACGSYLGWLTAKRRSGHG
jgi:hypothetical protein